MIELSPTKLSEEKNSNNPIYFGRNLSENGENERLKSGGSSVENKRTKRRRNKQNLGAEDDDVLPAKEVTHSTDQRSEISAKSRESEEQSVSYDVVDADESRQRKQRKKKKSRSSRKSRDGEVELYPGDSIEADLSHFSNDLVVAEGETFPSEKQQVWHSNVQSQPVGKVFIEHNDGFKALSKWKFVERSVSEDPESRKAVTSGTTAIDVGLSLHSYATRLSNYCHGILAGFSLWQCVMVYQLASPTFSSADFIGHYSFLASPAQALFYFLLALCFISVSARCDVGSLSGNCFSAICRPFNVVFIVVIIYLVTLLLSLSIAHVDDKLALQAYNFTGIDDSELQTWKNVNLCRCLGAMLAWLLLAATPEKDLLYENIKRLAELD